MNSSEFKLVSPDGNSIHVYEWLPDEVENIKAVVQIAHGMAEHAGRYADFANFLTSNNFAVYANDHRGHGKTAGDLKNVGCIDAKDGWAKIIKDFGQVGSYCKEQYPEKPLYTMGHSMGSFIVRNYIIESGSMVQGAIISATGDDPGFLGQFGRFLTSFLMIFYSHRSPSPLMDQLSFGAFNKPFKPNRTQFDWLSRDNVQVDKYVEDPYCGGVFSLGFFNNLLTGLLFVSKQENINRVPADLPILFFSGEKDPVGDNGKGVRAVYSRFEKAGLKNLQLNLFAEGRHEMLNEINNKDVYQYILDWLNKR